MNKYIYIVMNRNTVITHFVTDELNISRYNTMLRNQNLSISYNKCK